MRKLLQNGFGFSPKFSLGIWLMALMLLPAVLKAQVNLYTFSSSTGTYTPLTGTALTATSGTGQTALYNNIALPFTFTYNGTAQNTVSCNANGIVFFSPTAVVSPSSTGPTTNGINLIYAFAGSNMTGANGDVITGTLGTAPNRQFVIQYRDFTRTGGAGTNSRVNFQVILEETSNIVRFQYGSSVPPTNNATVQVGIRGTVTTDIIRLTGAWAAPTAITTGVTGTSTLPFSATGSPVDGSIYSFSPPVQYANDLRVVSFSNPPVGTLCDSTIIRNLRVLVQNRGTSSINGFGLQVRVVDTLGAIIHAETLTSSNVIAALGNDSLTISNFQCNGQSPYYISIISGTADDNASNDTLRATLRTSLSCSPLNYVYSQASETYSDIVGGTLISAPLEDNNRTVATRVITLPFNFTLDGAIFSSAFISTNGFIRLGTTAAGLAQNNPLSVAANNNTISPFGYDWYTGTTGEISYLSAGVAPNRTFTVEWKNMTNLTDVNINGNFQLILKESQEIEFRYGTYSYTGTATNFVAQIGVRGSAANRFQSRFLNTTVNTSLANNERAWNLSDAVSLLATTTVPSGLVLRFTPPPPAANDISVRTVLGLPTVNVCSGNTFSPRVIITNVGSSPFVSPQIRFTTRSSVGAVVNTQTVTGSASLGVGASDTISIPSFELPIVDAYSIRVVMNTSDDVASNDTARSAITVAACNLAPYTLSTSVVTFTPLVGGTTITYANTGADDGFATVALPTPFIFNGTPYSSVFVGTNGFINFGAAGSATTGPLTSVNNSVLAFGRDLVANATGSTYGIDAATGDFVIEYSGTQYISATVTGNPIRFQYRLRTNNSIQIVYDTVVLQTTGTNPGVGIRISGTQLTTLTNDGRHWASPIITSSTTSLMTFGLNAIIPVGLTYTWTPPLPNSSDIAVNSIINVPTGNQCTINSYAPKVVISNAGSAAYSNAQVLFTVKDALGAVVVNQTLNGSASLAVSQFDTLSVTPFLLPAAGVYSFVAKLISVDSVHTNDSVTINRTAIVCNFAPYTLSTSLGTFTPLVGGTAITFNGLLGVNTNTGSATIPLPVPFTFNGTSYSNVSAGTNGFINFGNGSRSATPLTVVNNSVIAFGRDLDATGNCTYGTDAASGDFVIEYIGIQNGAVGSTIIFQYRLRTDNSIQIVYDTVIGVTTTTNPGVGIRISATQLTSLTNNGGDWTSPVLNATTTSLMSFGPTSIIPIGLTYTWTPPLPSSSDVAVNSIINVPNGNQCSTSSLSPKVIIRNAGSTAFSNAQVLFTVKNATGAVIVSETLNGLANLAVGQFDTLTVTPFAFNGLGAFTMTAKLISVDSVNTNDSVNLNRTAIACNFAPFTLSTTVGTFTPLVGGTDVGFPTTDDDFTTINLPSPFTFNGTAYTSVSLGTNGFINFGAGSSSVSPITLVDNSVMAFGRDLDATGSCTYGVDATTGDFVIQYSGTQFNIAGSTIIFQYRLRNDRSIQIVYDTVIGVTTLTNPGVGIRISATQLTSLTNGSNWANPILNARTNALMTFGTNAIIPIGLTYTWTPPVPSSSDVAVNSIIGLPAGTQCTTVTYSPRVIISNAGSSAYSNAQVRFTVKNAISGVVVDETLTSNLSLAANQYDTLNVTSFVLNAAGTYTITAKLISADSVHTNDSIVSSTITRVCQLAPYTFASSVGTSSVFTGGSHMTFLRTTGTTTVDDGFATVPLPASFFFNGVAYDTVFVGTNGALGFTRSITGAIASTSGAFGTAGNMVAAFNRDLLVDSSRSNYGIDLATGDFVIQMIGTQYSPSTDSVIYQYRMRADRSIQVIYNNITPSATTSSPVVGLRTTADGITTLILPTGQVDWTSPSLTDVTTNTLTFGTTSIIPSGLTYTWTPPAATPIDAQLLGMAGLPASGCEGTTITPRVIVRSLGTASLVGGTITITVTPPAGLAVSYTVNRVADLASNTQDTTIGSDIQFANGAGSYTISASVAIPGDTINTNNTFTRSVTVNALPTTAPTITAGGALDFCPGGSVVLTSSSLTRNIWSNGATTRSITVRNPGSYTVQFTNASGCTSAVSAAVDVTSSTAPTTPTITASGPTTFCGGAAGSVTLTSSTADNYLWSNGATTQSITVNTQGTYWVNVGTTGVSCRSFNDTVRVIVSTPPATPTVTVTGGTTICSGTTTTLTAPVATAYLWSNGATTRAISVGISGTYTVVVSNAAGCTSLTSNAVNVTVNPSPAAVQITASGATNICSSDTVTISAPAGYAQYSWYNNGVAAGTTQSIRVSRSGRYYVKVGSGATCLSPNSDTVTVVATAAPNAPTITVGGTGTTVLCSGRDTAVLFATGGSSYLWSNGATTSSIRVATSGVYTVRAVGATCNSVRSNPITIVVNSSPAIPVVTITNNIATVVATGATRYSWSFNGFPIGGNFDTLRLRGDGNYTVKAFIGACSTQATFDVLGTMTRQYSKLEVFPIPATTKLDVKLAEVKGGLISLKLLDASGRIVLVKDVAINGSLDTSLELESIPAGLYQLVVTGDNLSVSRSVIKQ